MENIYFILVVIAHFFASSDSKRSPCKLAKQIGPCRFKEPCGPSVSSWNDSFVIVSWKDLFEECNKDQINKMYVKKTRKDKETDHENVIFSKNKTSLSVETCENSNISIRIDFRDVHVNANSGQGRTLFTHSINCRESLIKLTKSSKEMDSKAPLVSGIIGGVLIVFLLIIIVVVVLCKRRSKTDEKKNVKEKDINPVYGDYYYQDGNRRQNIVEVSILFYGHCSSVFASH